MHTHTMNVGTLKMSTLIPVEYSPTWNKGQLCHKRLKSVFLFQSQFSR